MLAHANAAKYSLHYNHLTQRTKAGKPFTFNILSVWFELSVPVQVIAWRDLETPCHIYLLSVGRVGHIPPPPPPIYFPQ